VVQREESSTRWRSVSSLFGFMFCDVYWVLSFHGVDRGGSVDDTRLAGCTRGLVEEAHTLCHGLLRTPVYSTLCSVL